MHLILAGNKWQFDDYIKRHKLNRDNYFYPVNFRDFAGRQFESLTKVGTWYCKWTSEDIDIIFNVFVNKEQIASI